MTQDWFDTKAKTQQIKVWKRIFHITKKATSIVEKYMMKWTINSEPKSQKNSIFIPFVLMWNLQMLPPGKVYFVSN